MVACKFSISSNPMPRHKLRKPIHSCCLVCVNWASINFHVSPLSSPSIPWNFILLDLAFVRVISIILNVFNLLLLFISSVLNHNPSSPYFSHFLSFLLCSFIVYLFLLICFNILFCLLHKFICNLLLFFFFSFCSLFSIFSCAFLPLFLTFSSFIVFLLSPPAMTWLPQLCLQDLNRVTRKTILLAECIVGFVSFPSKQPPIFYTTLAGSPLKWRCILFSVRSLSSLAFFFSGFSVWCYIRLIGHLGWGIGPSQRFSL
jgi:hypothetical protein